jgi:hypothetical protein
MYHYINSKAPTLNQGPIRWGSVPGIHEVIERRPDESEDDFVARLVALHPTPQERLISITIHADTLKPELPSTSPQVTFPEAANVVRTQLDVARILMDGGEKRFP